MLAGLPFQVGGNDLGFAILDRAANSIADDKVLYNSCSKTFHFQTNQGRVREAPITRG